jgi:predicted Fe-Mo cluster-binding NifX family protein
MRIAVSTETNAGLDAPVAGHFGRCPFFTLVDLETDQIRSVQVVPNPYFPAHEPGQVPQFIQSQGANAMLTGGMGDRAAAFFEQYGIRPVTGATGTVRQALDSFQRGELGGWAPCDESVAHGHAHDHGHGQDEGR